MSRFDARYIVGPVAKAGRVLDFVLSQVHAGTSGSLPVKPWPCCAKPITRSGWKPNGGISISL